MVIILPSEDCAFRLDSKYGFNHAANLPVTYTDVTLDDRGFGFNGSSSYVDCGNNIFNNHSQGTISLWIYTTDASQHSIFFGGASTINANSIFWIDLFNNVRVGANNNIDILRGNTIIKNNTIYHIVATSDGTTTKIYINGKAEIITVVSGSNTGKWMSSSINGTQRYSIGALFRSTGIISYYNGSIDKISIYNRALTAQEVADRYNKYTFGGHL